MPARALGHLPGGIPVTKVAGRQTLYRGVNLDLPSDIATQIRKLLQPPLVEEERDQDLKIGGIIVDYLSRGYDDRNGMVGLGRHWTTRLQMAQTAAHVGGGWGFVLTADWDGTMQDAEETGTGKGWAGGWADEKEVTLLPGAPLTITSVHLEGIYEQEVLKAPIRAKAKKVDEYVDLTPEQKERFAGTTVRKDDKGYYCHTHRARSKSYESVDKIPDSKVKFIESTGAVLADANDGVMVALVPPEAVSQKLLDLVPDLDTEPVDQSHLTLVYLGDREEVSAGEDNLLTAVADFVHRHRPPVGHPNGLGTFANEDEHVLIALWDIPSIAEFRADLVRTLLDHGIQTKNDHGWMPHQTLAYADEPVTELPVFPTGLSPDVDFGAVIVAWGDTWTPVHFEGTTRVSKLADFDPAEHPRGGDPKNPGEFSAKPGGPSTKAPDAPRKKKYSPEIEKKVRERGDLYGHYLPKGKYDEGDPRNDPEYEEIDQRIGGLWGRYVTPSREDIKKAEGKGVGEAQLASMYERYRQGKEDRDKGIGGDTQERYDKRPNPATGAREVYAPERQELHNQIIDSFTKRAKSVPKQGRCLIMAGPSGAGKSTFLKDNADQLGVKMTKDSAGKDIPANYIIINPDDLKDYLPVEHERYPGLKANEMAGITHEESSTLAKQLVNNLMSQGYNVILDITLADAAKAKEKYVDPFDKDYEYTSVLVDGDMRNSLNNAGIRYKQPDKETGERTYSGRFVPTSLVLTQKPTKEGYRSKNAQEFESFVTDDRVDRGLIYDPLTKKLTKVKGGSTTSALSAILRGEGGRKMALKTTEITEKIKAFNAGRLSRAELVTFLTREVNYVEPSGHGAVHGTPEHYLEGLDPGGYTPGSYDEVKQARYSGLLDPEVFSEVNKILYEEGVA